MRHTSIYEIDCAECGKQHQNSEPSGACPHCGAAYRVEWPASTGATHGGTR